MFDKKDIETLQMVTKLLHKGKYELDLKEISYFYHSLKGLEALAQKINSEITSQTKATKGSDNE